MAQTPQSYVNRLLEEVVVHRPFVVTTTQGLEIFTGLDAADVLRWVSAKYPDLEILAIDTLH